MRIIDTSKMEYNDELHYNKNMYSQIIENKNNLLDDDSNNNNKNLRKSNTCNKNDYNKYKNENNNDNKNDLDNNYDINKFKDYENSNFNYDNYINDNNSLYSNNSIENNKVTKNENNNNLNKNKNNNFIKFPNNKLKFCSNDKLEIIDENLNINNSIKNNNNISKHKYKNLSESSQSDLLSINSSKEMNFNIAEKYQNYINSVTIIQKGIRFYLKRKKFFNLKILVNNKDLITINDNKCREKKINKSNINNIFFVYKNKYKNKKDNINKIIFIQRFFKSFYYNNINYYKRINNNFIIKNFLKEKDLNNNNINKSFDCIPNTEKKNNKKNYKNNNINEFSINKINNIEFHNEKNNKKNLEYSPCKSIDEIYDNNKTEKIKYNLLKKILNKQEKKYEKDLKSSREEYYKKSLTTKILKNKLKNHLPKNLIKILKRKINNLLNNFLLNLTNFNKNNTNSIKFTINNINNTINELKIKKFIYLIYHNLYFEFFYRLVIIYIINNDIEINNNKLLNYLKKGFYYDYLFTLKNVFSLNLTSNHFNLDHKRNFINYIQNFVDFNFNDSNNYYLNNNNIYSKNLILKNNNNNYIYQKKQNLNQTFEINKINMSKIEDDYNNTIMTISDFHNSSVSNNNQNYKIKKTNTEEIMNLKPSEIIVKKIIFNNDSNKK